MEFSIVDNSAILFYVRLAVFILIFQQRYRANTYRPQFVSSFNDISTRKHIVRFYSVLIEISLQRF